MALKVVRRSCGATEPRARRDGPAQEVGPADFLCRAALARARPRRPGPGTAARLAGCAHGGRRDSEDFLRRLHDACTPTQFRRFADALKSYTTGVAWEVAGQDASVRTRLNDAVACRINAAGVVPTVTGLLATHDLHVPDAEFHRPEVRAFTEAAGLLVALHNDVFSYAKEQADDSGDVNLLDALRAETGCELLEGAARLIGLTNRVTARAVHLRRTLAPTASPDLRRYLDAGLDMAAGSIAFGRHCVRYRRGTSHTPLPPVTVTHERPAGTPSGPPGIPTIDWWWDDPEPAFRWSTFRRTATPWPYLTEGDRWARPLRSR
ncbi:terpene synthase family protein [Kitasatospora sp. NPDC004799]|uniref:terpene synthase family protein n=1 Tax=Kitasatospora sp. NPDC004799 TaxID=3154460 RepID=UPI0033B28510